MVNTPKEEELIQQCVQANEGNAELARQCKVYKTFQDGCSQACSDLGEGIINAEGLIAVVTAACEVFEADIGNIEPI